MNNIEKLAIDELEEIAKTHPRAALQTAYGEGVLAGINQAKALQSSEPVAYLKFVSRQWLISPDIGMDGFQGFEVCDRSEKGDDGSDAFAVFTHPPSSVPLEKYNKLLDALKNVIDENKFNRVYSPNALFKVTEELKAEQAIAEAELSEGKEG